MSDDTKNDRKNSLNARFQGGDDKASTEEQTDKTPKTDKTESNDRPSTKDKTALTMYLPRDLVKDEDLHFQRLSLEHQEEYDEKLEKNADYWPAVFEAAHSEKTVREVLDLDG